MIRLSMQTKITGLIFFIVGFSLLLAGSVVIGEFIHSKEEELTQRSLITARTVAGLSAVRENIDKDTKTSHMNQMIEPIRIIHGADYIVILDMNHIRLSHPNSTMVGKISTGKDEGPAFAEHISKLESY
jgi:two-component system sensor histidine kinase DctS